MTSTKRKWIAEGYQMALADVLAALDNGGEAAARRWIKDNMEAGRVKK